MPPKPRITIIAADFNKSLLETMIAAATAELGSEARQPPRLIRVPGCYEVPLAAELALAKADALIVLGYIERGDTLHGEVMGNVVHTALVQLELKYRKPIAIGIIGPGATAEQAEARKTPYAQAAARAAMTMLGVAADVSKPARASSKPRRK